jgi:hypothetical protein
MKIWRQTGLAAFAALCVLWVASAQANVTYVFMPSTLTRSITSTIHEPVPFDGPIGKMTITDAAFAERRIDNYLDVVDFFFEVPTTGLYSFEISHLTPCQLPTITGNCSRFSPTIEMTLTPEGNIDSGFINYAGGYWHLPLFDWFDSDRWLLMSGSEGDWSGRHVGETGICGNNPGCLFDGRWVPIPEPATASLLGAGFGIAFWLRRRRCS